MIEPADYDPKKTPAIKLGGKLWPVPEFGIRQLREVRDPLIEMNAKIVAVPRDGAEGDAIKAVDNLFINLKRADFDRLIVDPIYWALTRLHPAIKMDDYLDMAATEAELIAGWFIVQRQSGIFETTGAPPTGEAVAVETES